MLRMRRVHKWHLSCTRSSARGTARRGQSAAAAIGGSLVYPKLGLRRARFLTSLPLARRETVHGQAGFRPCIRARRGSRGGRQRLAIHGLTPSGCSPRWLACELNEQAKPLERGGRGEREERQKNLKLSALFAPSVFNGLEDWAAVVCTSIFPVLPSKVSHAGIPHQPFFEMKRPHRTEARRPESKAQPRMALKSYRGLSYRGVCDAWCRARW
jgi:hypothetical protein